MVATASPAAQRGAASTSAALNAAYGPATLRAPSCVRAAALATSTPPLSSQVRRSAAAAPAAAAQNSLASHNTLAAHTTPACRQSPTKRAPTTGSGNASRRSLASSHSRASQVTASLSSACLEGRRTAGCASGASQKAAVGKAAAAKRLAELARVQQLLREQDETQHQLVVETQQLRVQQAQLKALLIKTSAETATKPDTSHRIEKVIEQHKVELRALQVKITEREAKLSAHAEAAKAGVKERKHAPEQANEREALERALGQLEGRLEHNMKKMDEFRGKSGQLRRLIDEARSRRNLENERIDELRADIEQRREKRSTLAALAVEHAEATAEAEAQLEELRKIASVERAAFERKQAAMTMQLKDAKLVLSTSVGDTAVELPTGDDFRPLKRSLSRLSFQQQLEEERHKRSELSKRRSSIKYHSVRDSMQFISEKEKLHVIQETAQAQQQGWNDLCARTGVSDPEEVITHMLETESEATRLWHKQRALESEYKAESQRLARVRAELERLKSERRKTELAAKHRVSELHERSSSSEMEIAKLRRQISSVQGSLDAAAQELAALMLKLRADRTLSYLEVPQPIAFFENHVLPGCSIVSSADHDAHAPRMIHSTSQSEHPHIEVERPFMSAASLRSFKPPVIPSASQPALHTRSSLVGSQAQSPRSRPAEHSASASFTPTCSCVAHKPHDGVPPFLSPSRASSIHTDSSGAVDATIKPTRPGSEGAHSVAAIGERSVEDFRPRWNDVSWSDIEVLFGSFEEVMEYMLHCLQYLFARRLLTKEAEIVLSLTGAGTLNVQPHTPKSFAPRRLLSNSEMPRIPMEERSASSLSLGGASDMLSFRACD